jgi:spore germination protein GerM
LRPGPREFRGRLRQQLLVCFEEARHLADEYHWAYNAAHAQSVGDEAKVRSHAADPTGSVALDGHIESSERDRVVRGKAALRRQMDRSNREVQIAMTKLSNVLDGEARKLEKAIEYLKPGPSVKNPRFEKVIVGDSTLGKAEMEATLEARDRRHARGERFGG